MRPLSRLATDERGVTIVEFGIIAPVMCLLLVGAFDVGHTLYTQAVLHGALQKAARDSGLESGTNAMRQAEIDRRVRAQVQRLDNKADLQFSRRFYRSFSEAAAANPEQYTDTNGNRRCDQGEPFEDRNNNRVWDADGGDGGQGGAKDSVLYTVTYAAPRMLPLHGFIDISDTKRITASTIMNNQPYGDQTSYAQPTIRNCPA